MKYIKLFEDHNKVLIIVDVQKSFFKFFNNKFLSELNKYCSTFNSVYQIWDNHSDGKNPDIDFLYHSNPDIENKNDLYTFNNQLDLIEKRYNYDVNVDFYKNILDEKLFNSIKEKETNKTLKIGESFKTNKNTLIVYIGNNHNWFHVGVKMYEFFNKLKNKEIIIVGGSSGECLTDVLVAARSLGLNIKENRNYIYSATNCPIK